MATFLRHLFVCTNDRGPGHPRGSCASSGGAEVARAKLFATETASWICDRAVQHFGGLGVKRGEVVERLFREVRALRIYEGTSEVQKLILAKALLAEGPDRG